MTYVLHLSPAIEGDVAAAADYYAEIDPGLAMRFADELERTFRLVESYPLAGRILYGLQRHQLHTGDDLVQVFEPELTPLQHQVLDLLHVPAAVYTTNT